MTKTYLCSRCKQAVVAKQPGRGRPPLCATCKLAGPKPHLRRLYLRFAASCDVCGARFVSAHRKARYCSKHCGDMAHYHQVRSDPERWRARLDKSIHMNGKRRVGVAATGTDLTPQVVRELKAAATYCPLCDCALGNDPSAPSGKHVDHIVPVAVGGAHERANVRVVCAECNRSRPRDGSDLPEGGSQIASFPLRRATPGPRHEKERVAKPFL